MAYIPGAKHVGLLAACGGAEATLLKGLNSIGGTLKNTLSELEKKINVGLQLYMDKLIIELEILKDAVPIQVIQPIRIMAAGGLV